MFDCNVFQSYSGTKRVQVWHAGLSEQWNLGMPLMRRHPPCDHKRKDLMQKEQSKVISMLVAIETKDGLRRGAIMVICQRIGLPCAEQKACVSWA